MRTVAFYLPQFHAIPENDRWWGEGFTEWVNVRRARPQFEGHDHPRVAGELGEYNLLDPTVQRRQTDLAREFGVDAFCMYFYWFDGHRLLEKPVEMWRSDGTLLPYCLSWANEAWTRRWDGKERDVLMPQGYDTGFEDGLFKDLLPHFQAPHYMKQGGSPILLFHRADLLPDPRGTASRLRELARDAGLPGLHLVAAETTPDLRPDSLGFDAVAEFPPVGANTFATAQRRPVAGLAADFRGRLMSYDRLVDHFLNRPRPSFVRYRAVAPSWDNTARRGGNATVYVGSTPLAYSRWLASSREAERQQRGSDGLVFINAWNEWAEGAYLEPDATNGRAYLEATAGRASSLPLPARIPSGRFSFPHLRSVALTVAGSLLAFRRRLRNRWGKRS